MSIRGEYSILSFDVGIRHLAFCHLVVAGQGTPSYRIEDWDVIDLDKVPSVETCAERLMRELHARFPASRFDVVLVERQPKSRSIIMVAVQMFLCAYFSLAKVDATKRVGQVKFISATRKLDMSLLPPPLDQQAPEPVVKSYAANKAYAVKAARYYLEHVLEDFANLCLLDTYKKKDDLCDALLQGIAYVESGGEVCRTRAYARRKQVGARRRLVSS